MYSKRVVHKAYVDGNAYITVNDPYVVRNGNPFRAPVKGEKLKNFDIPVRSYHPFIACIFHAFDELLVTHPFALILILHSTPNAPRLPPSAE